MYWKNVLKKKDFNIVYLIFYIVLDLWSYIFYIFLVNVSIHQEKPANICTFFTVWTVLIYWTEIFKIKTFFVLPLCSVHFTTPEKKTNKGPFEKKKKKRSSSTILTLCPIEWSGPLMCRVQRSCNKHCTYCSGNVLFYFPVVSHMLIHCG